MSNYGRRANRCQPDVSQNASHSVQINTPEQHNYPDFEFGPFLNLCFGSHFHIYCCKMKASKLISQKAVLCCCCFKSRTTNGLEQPSYQRGYLFHLWIHIKGVNNLIGRYSGCSDLKIYHGLFLTNTHKNKSDRVYTYCF